ncbi:MAG: hypothetical protein HY304_08455 [candidate division Zixibacteria bacterium]|nr:hypothetical protein [candidate division Zixibacteria bacterium]
MRLSHILTTAGILAMIGGFAIGCSGNSGVSTSGAQDLNLTSQYGGYTDSDELPAFGDVAMAQALGEDPPGDDLDSAEADSLSDPHAQVFFLAIRWGHLDGDSGIVTPTDWSGSIEVGDGTIRVLRLIRFEHMEDHIVRPRANRRRLEWVSHTTHDFDGLLLMIRVPRDSAAAKTLTPNQLVFTTVPYSRTFSLDELANLQEVIDVGTEGNQIAFNSRDKDLFPCGNGSLEGVWMANRHGDLGHFFGKWTSEDGVLMGHLRGHFGHRADGQNVFFGKYIGDDGRFHGLVRGEWGITEGDSISGWFDGTWAARHDLPTGHLHGEWHSSADDGGLTVGQDHRHGEGQGDDNEHHHFDHVTWGKGFFSGWWERDCDSTGSGT